MPIATKERLYQQKMCSMRSGRFTYGWWRRSWQHRSFQLHEQPLDELLTEQHCVSKVLRLGARNLEAKFS